MQVMKGRAYLMVIWLCVIHFSLIAKDSTYHVIEENGKQGLADGNGKVVIPAEYEAIGWSLGEPIVIEKIIGYKENGLWGLLDLKNNKVTPAQFPLLYPSNELLIAGKKAPQSNEVLLGIISTKGKITLPLRYKSIESKGIVYLVSLSSNGRVKWGVLNQDFDVIISVDKDTIEKIPQGFVCKQGGQYAFFGSLGDKLTEYIYDQITPLCDNNLKITINSLCGVMDAQGKILVPPLEKNISCINNHYQIVPFPNWTVLTATAQSSLQFKADSISTGPNSFIAYKNGRAWKNAKDILPALLIEKKENKYGLVDHLRQEIMPLQYDSIYLTDEFILALKNKQWQVFNHASHEIAYGPYDEIIPQEEGFFQVKRDNHWGMLNKQGYETIFCKYNSLGDLHAGSMEAIFLEGKGILDLNGEWMVPPYYDSLFQINEDLYWFKKGKTNGLYKVKEGEVFSTPDKLAISGQNILHMNGGKLGIFNSSGIRQLPTVYEQIKIHAPNSYATTVDGKKGFWHEGKWLMTPTDRYQDFALPGVGDNFIPVKITGQWGFADPQGRLRVSNRYDDIRGYSEGWAAIKLRDHWGFIDKKESIVIQPTYDNISNLKDGLFIAQREGKYSLNSTEGVILNLVFEQIEPRGNDFFLIKKDGKFGLANKNGMVVQPSYDRIERLSNGCFLIERQGSFGLLSPQGVSTIPLQYDQLIFSENVDLFFGKMILN